MKYLKLASLIQQGAPFYSLNHRNDNTYALRPFKRGVFELYKDGYKVHHILVFFVRNSLVSVGYGSRHGHVELIHLEDVEFPNRSDHDFDGAIEEEHFSAHFDGMEVNLTGDDTPPVTRLQVEHNLF